MDKRHPSKFKTYDTFEAVPGIKKQNRQEEKTHEEKY